MLSEKQINEWIATVEAAITKDGFTPSPDGKKLAEHLYYVRIGMLDAFRVALDEAQPEDIPDIPE